MHNESGQWTVDSGQRTSGQVNRWTSEQESFANPVSIVLNLLYI